MKTKVVARYCAKNKDTGEILKPYFRANEDVIPLDRAERILDILKDSAYATLLDFYLDSDDIQTRLDSDSTGTYHG